MKKKILECFGFHPLDKSESAIQSWNTGICPFVNSPCIKITRKDPMNPGLDTITGVCSVNYSDVNIPVCPKRFYGTDAVFQEVASDAFGVSNVISEANYDNLLPKPTTDIAIYIRELSVGGKSIDWIVALVGDSRIKSYIPVELQTLDTTGSYIHDWINIRNNRNGLEPIFEKKSWGMNWANVQKRLLVQLMAKGNLTRVGTGSTFGLYFLVPDIVFSKFTNYMNPVEEIPDPGPETLTVMTYDLSDPISGNHGVISLNKVVRYRISQFNEAVANFSASADMDSAVEKRLGLQLA